MVPRRSYQPDADADRIEIPKRCAPAASACPSCSVGQGLETLAYVLAFMAIPYLVVSGVLYWMRKLTAQERGF